MSTQATTYSVYIDVPAPYGSCPVLAHRGTLADAIEVYMDTVAPVARLYREPVRGKVTQIA